MAIAHYNITITGDVQGLGFRYYTKQQADALGITGTIQNEQNGDVYCEAEGESESLRQFIDWCHHGPEHARVRDVMVEEGAVQHVKQFTIIR